MGAQFWESVHDYVTKVDAELDGYGKSYHDGVGKEWDDGVKYTEAIRRAKEGDPAMVSPATDTMRRVAPIIDDNLRMCNLRTLCGTRVSVPDYLGGSPRCMVRRVKAPRMVPHVNLFVCIVSSCGLSAEKLLKRGATILALLEYLQACQIGVDLHLLVELDGDNDQTGDYVQCIRVESQPLDLSTAAFAIAHPAFARNVTYAYAQKFHGFCGGWPRNLTHDWATGADGQPTKEQVRWFDMLRSFGVPIKDTDIYIPHAYMTDELMTQPEKWLEARIRSVVGVAP